MVNIKVKSLVTHNPNLILLSIICCFKAGHPFSTCGDESLVVLVLSIFYVVLKLKTKQKNYLVKAKRNAFIYNNIFCGPFVPLTLTFVLFSKV